MERFTYYLIPIALGLWIGWLLSGRGRAKANRLDKTRVQHLDVASFKQTMRKGQLIDIRKSDEFEKAHIKGARNYRPAFLKSKSQRQIRKDQPLFIYCNTGRRTHRLAMKLLKKGYPSVFTLDGGYEAFKKEQG